MMSCSISSSSDKEVIIVSENDNKDGDEDEGVLPGFRFHPTDEELVLFYLKKKIVEKRRWKSIDKIIKEIDIYKHDPWDLIATFSKSSSNSSSSSGVAGDNKEWYFYCKRGRKYRNSIRPNRVTGSGFWKATGIDKPIYSNGGQTTQFSSSGVIGLKKSLVYYRGCAGKGTKTDWMMHEFRLPTHQTPAIDEAEIWTVCRIFKRNKKQTPDWKELSARRNTHNHHLTSETTSMHDDSNSNHERYITFSTGPTTPTDNITSQIINNNHTNQPQWSSTVARHLTPIESNSSSWDDDLQCFYQGDNSSWDDLSSVVEFAVRTPLL